jgi:energy-coupling factor transport system substrate-specific component
MRELFTMWRDTRMIMLVAVVAAVYAAVLLPFKLFTIIPGITSVRPANVFPVIFSLMFGPAAAWGAAIGNLIGDIFGGTLGPGSIFGFVGNFFFGFVGYKLWGNLLPLSSGSEPDFREDAGKQLAEFVVVALIASIGCAAIIAWGLDLLGIVPFAVLATTITINNSLAAIVLGPPLLYLTWPRVKEMGLLYPDVMADEDIADADLDRSRLASWGTGAVVVAWLVVGLFVLSSAPGTTGQMALGAVGLVLVAVLMALAGERMTEFVGTGGSTRRPPSAAGETAEDDAGGPAP